jgi:hypothetical protein
VDLTPEEKLLKIIEQPSNADSKKIVDELRKDSFNSKRHRAKEFFVALKARMSLKAAVQFLSTLTLPAIRLFLILVGGALTLALVVNFVMISHALRVRARAVERDRKKDEKIIVAKAQEEKFLPLDDYMNEGKKHNIFSLIPQGIEPAVKEDLFNEVQALQVVGILWDASPQVMIEDPSSKETVMLYEGQKIGKFTVKQIFRDHIVLQWGTYEWEKR